MPPPVCGPLAALLTFFVRSRALTRFCGLMKFTALLAVFALGLVSQSAFADPLLAIPGKVILDTTLSEWDSPEDEAAYRDLPVR